MTLLLETIASYVPTWIRRRAAPTTSDEAARVQPLLAAVFFADISGFTPLAKRLAEHQAEGAEELNRILNQYFGTIVDSIYDHGGDIVRFAGDAVLAFWHAESEPLAECVVSATECGLQIQKRLQNFVIGCEERFGLQESDIRLSLRINVTAGEIALADVGGVDDKRQLLMVGPPLAQLRIADQHAKAGRVVLSPEATSVAAERVLGEPLPAGHLQAMSAEQGHLRSDADRNDCAAIEDCLRQYVPAVVLSRLDAGQDDFMADLRLVSIVFIKLTGLDGTTVENIGALQTVMEVLQTASQKFNGELYQLVADDKGTVGITCFGLPHRTSDDNPLRAVRMAAHVREELVKRGLNPGIGIATGKIFCGPVGNSRRREYTIHGSPVNFSARLMQAADGDILCDEATQQGVHTSIVLQELPRFHFKGFDGQAARIFRAPEQAAGSVGGGPEIIGRKDEWELLQRVIANAKQSRPQAVLLEGEAGIGKSALTAELIRAFEKAEFTTLAGHCQAIERMTPYFGFRMIFQQLLALNRLTGSDERISRLRECLSPLPNGWRAGSLLNSLLGLNLQEDSDLKQLSGRARGELINDLLVTLLVNRSAQESLVLVLEDVHWLDSASWALVLLIAQRTNVTLICTLRPQPTLPLEQQQLAGMPRTVCLALDSLAREDTDALIQRTLGWRKIAPELVDHLHNTAQGNPLFVEELARYLRDAGRLIVEKGVCQLSARSKEDVQALPTTILDVITNRIDQLTPQQQLTLKTASVVGRRFPHETVSAVYPVERDRRALDQIFHSLQMVDLIRRDCDVAPTTSLFKHVTIHEAAYQQLPMAQRRALHRAVAMWYEATYGATPGLSPILAHHWGKVGDADKEAHYLSAAGEEALLTNASAEAVGFFAAAIQCHHRQFGNQPTASQRMRLARLLRQLGEAKFKLGHLHEARLALENSLEHLNCPTYSQGWRLTASTVRELLVQAVRLTRAAAFGPRAPRAADGDATGKLETSLALQRISQIHYFTNEIAVGSNRALRALNIGESLSDSPGLTRSYANMCIVMGLVGCHPLARYYARLAFQVGERAGHKPSLVYAIIVTAMYYLGQGQWRTVEQTTEHGLKIAEQLADQRLLGETLCVQAMLACFRGNYADSAELFQRIAELAERNGNTLHLAWGRCGLGECRFREGKLEDARCLLEESLAILKDGKNRTEEIRANGLLAHTYARLGRFADAARCAAIGQQIIAQGLHTTCSTLEGYAGIVESYLLAWEHDPTDTMVARSAAEAQSLLAGYARRFPIGRPRALRCAGTLAWLQNKQHLAVKRWKQSSRNANRLGLRLELGLAHSEIARHVVGDQSTQQASQQQAIKILSDLGTQYEIDKLQRASLRSFR